MKTFFQLRPGDDLFVDTDHLSGKPVTQRVVAVKEWTYPDGHGVREVQAEVPSPPGARRMVVAPSWATEGDPEYRSLHYVPGTTSYAEDAIREDLLGQLSRRYGLTGRPAPGELHDGPPAKE